MQRSSTAGVKHLFSIATLTAILLSGACTSSNSLLSPEDEKEAANRCTDPQNPITKVRATMRATSGQKKRIRQ